MRFSILARVSTTEQEDKGTSLEVQQKTLRRCVEQLNGTVVKEYIGQESAMGVKERPIFEELLTDCSRNLFDAVIVYDLSRWSRNPEKSRYGLAILKKNGIKLFIQNTEYNLSNPETDLIVGILNELNAFSVNLQTRKAMESKIELARRGWAITIPPHGRKPVHSDKSKPCEWKVIQEDKEQAERIYQLYVEENMGLERVADELGLTKAHTRNILLKYSGDTWVQKVKYEGRNEEITIKVPPLLTPEQIEKAKFKARSNKQFNSRKYEYLLGGRVKCGVCKMTFIGMSAMDRGKIRRYYTHSRHFRTEICIKNIAVEIVETAVLRAISDLFSSTKNLRLAIENAIGVSKDRKEILVKRIEECNKKLAKLDTEKSRLVQAVKKGLFDDGDISAEMSKIREGTLETREALSVATDQLKALMIDIPDDLHLRIQKYYNLLCGEQGSIADWGYESQKRLIDWFFGIGKEQGAFVLKEQDGIAFNVVGALGGSLIGLVEGDRVSTSVIGVDTIDNTFAATGIADFQHIIQEIDFYTKQQISENLYFRVNGMERIPLAWSVSVRQVEI